jgi:hypothetical protein
MKEWACFFVNLLLMHAIMIQVFLGLRQLDLVGTMCYTA